MMTAPANAAAQYARVRSNGNPVIPRGLNTVKQQLWQEGFGIESAEAGA